MQPCQECLSLRRELSEAIAAEPLPVERDFGDLRGWLEELDEDRAAQIRRTSPVWKAWRKIVDHRARTGHAVSMIPSRESFETLN